MTSSKSITCGSIISARAIATRCCWPPESWCGCWCAFSSSPTCASSSWARASASLRPSLRMRRAASVRLSSTVRCGKRLNCWKTIPIRCRTRETSVPLPVISCALEEDPARVERLEQVDAAEERALAAAARPDHDEHLAGRDLAGRCRPARGCRRSSSERASSRIISPAGLALAAAGDPCHRPPPRGAHSRARRSVPAVPSILRLMRRLPPQGVAAHLRTATGSCRGARPAATPAAAASAAEALRHDDAGERQSDRIRVGGRASKRYALIARLPTAWKATMSVQVAGFRRASLSTGTEAASVAPGAPARPAWRTSLQALPGLG